MPDGLICPFKPCGSHESCPGCIYDPEKREIDREEFLDNWYLRSCRDCQHCHDGNCKRLDHKKYKLSKRWFSVYDPGNGYLCSDFEPFDGWLWLHRHWKPEFLKHPDPNSKRYVSLTLDGDNSVWYYVKYVDYFYGNHITEDGSYKWVFKSYMKKTRKCEEYPLGYVLVNEYPDGSIYKNGTDKMLRAPRDADKEMEKPGVVDGEVMKIIEEVIQNESEQKL